MLDKELIKKRFKKSIKTYNSNASVQKIAAEELLLLLGEKKFKNILEIGSYTGILTEKLVEKYPDFISYTAIDIISESEEYIKKINKKIIFLNEDVENFKTEKKFDLIIANASLQWCNDIKKVIKKLQSFLSYRGVIAFSVFSQDNFFEIKDVFNVGLNYLSIKELNSLFNGQAAICEKKYELKFENSFEVLRHLRNTGVNAIRRHNFSVAEIKEKMKNYEIKYNNRLTYCPLYVIYQDF